MNAITNDIGAQTELSLERAHFWRSKLVEKCAEGERHIVTLLRKADIPFKGKAPLSQKIETLKRTLDVDADRPLLGVLEALRPISDLRSDLVHSTVTIARVENETVAVFRSSIEEQDAAGTRRIMTSACLKNAHRDASRVANRLKQEAGRG